MGFVYREQCLIYISSLFPTYLFAFCFSPSKQGFFSIVPNFPFLRIFLSWLSIFFAYPIPHFFPPAHRHSALPFPLYMLLLCAQFRKSHVKREKADADPESPQCVQPSKNPTTCLCLSRSHFVRFHRGLPAVPSASVPCRRSGRAKLLETPRRTCNIPTTFSLCFFRVFSPGLSCTRAANYSLPSLPPALLRSIRCGETNE